MLSVAIADLRDECLELPRLLQVRERRSLACKPYLMTTEVRVVVVSGIGRGLPYSPA
jgi:hypothetical protein